MLALSSIDKLDEKIFRQTMETILAFSNAISARDKYTSRHSHLVANFAYHIARQLGISSKEIQLLYWASMLHDVGKIGISEDILNKKDNLTVEESQIIRQHTVIGAKILEPLKSIKEIIPIIYHHHERFDGNGYPDRLKGQEIPLLSRIIAVADAFEAMTSERSYRDKMQPEVALSNIKLNSGTQFDPKIVKCFEDVYKKGNKLSTLLPIEYLI